MQEDALVPATKADVKMIMEELARLYQNMVTKDDLDAAITASEDRMRGYADEKAGETKSHFDVVAENLHYDLLGAHKDRIESHEDRIVRLEQHTGLGRAA